MSQHVEMTWENASQAFLHLVGADLRDFQREAERAIYHGTLKQNEMPLIQYVGKFRALKLRSKVTKSMACDAFVRGLNPTVRSRCAHPLSGGEWIKLEDCITLAVSIDRAQQTLTGNTKDTNVSFLSYT